MALSAGIARSPPTISSTRTAASCRWCARATAPGMPARVSGAAARTSTRIPSASKSSIRGTSSAIAVFHGGRSARSSISARGLSPAMMIQPQHVLAHSDVAPGRKIDPGEKFPWRKLAEAGVGHFVAPARAGGRSVLRPATRASQSRSCSPCCRSMATASTSPAATTDPTGVVVAAFQRHFRPRRVDGLADRSTVDTLRRLLQAQPLETT